MDLPLAAGLAFGNPQLALVEQLERMIHRIPDFAPGCGGDAIARSERGIDGGFESGKRHRVSLSERVKRRMEGLFSGFGDGESRLTAAHLDCHHRHRVSPSSSPMTGY